MSAGVALAITLSSTALLRVTVMLVIVMMGRSAQRQGREVDIELRQLSQHLYFHCGPQTHGDTSLD